MSEMRRIEFRQRLTADGRFERTNRPPDSDDWTEMVLLVWEQDDRVAQIEMTADAYADEGVRRVVYEELAQLAPCFEVFARLEGPADG